MSKICAKCSKSVYPLEELKCLEKIWHKACFKCTECGMILNMKNYKGFDKKPYCSAHYPHTKATVVADTPEMARIAQNTKIQSQVKYHEEFEKKIRGSKIEVTDDPESRRIKRIGSIVSEVEYRGTKPEMQRRLSIPPSTSAASHTVIEEQNVKPSPQKDRATSRSTVYSAAGGKADIIAQTRRIGSIADYDPLNENYGSLTHGYQPSSRGSVSGGPSFEWEETIDSPSVVQKKFLLSSSGAEDKGSQDVDKTDGAANSEDVFESHVAPAETQPSPTSATNDVVDNQNGCREEEAAYSSDAEKPDNIVDPVDETVEVATHSENVESSINIMNEAENNGSDSAIGESDIHLSGSDVEPSTTTNVDADEVHEDVKQDADKLADKRDDEEEEADSVPAATTLEQDSSGVGTDANEEDDVPPTVDGGDTVPQDKVPGPVFQAVYDYEAQDEDEVSFTEGNHIVEVQLVGEGWMYGRVVETGKCGMLPSNYVEPFVNSAD